MKIVIYFGIHLFFLFFSGLFVLLSYRERILFAVVIVSSSVFAFIIVCVLLFFFSFFFYHSCIPFILSSFPFFHIHFFLLRLVLPFPSSVFPITIIQFSFSFYSFSSSFILLSLHNLLSFRPSFFSSYPVSFLL